VDNQGTKNKQTLCGLSPQANYAERPPLVGEVNANFSNRGYRVVSTMDPHGCILGFLNWIRYYFFQVAIQLYLQG
jgi:hypothetical protein